MQMTWQPNGHPTGCTCHTCPPRAVRTPDIEPGTPEHAAWHAEQEVKQRAYEERFAASSTGRPGHWGIGQHLAGTRGPHNTELTR